MVCSWGSNRYRLGTLVCQRTFIAFLARLARWFKCISLWPHSRCCSSATSIVWWALGQRPYRGSLFSFIWRCALGLHACNGSNSHLHACYEDCASTGRSQSPYDGSRACRILQPLATGWSWHHHPRLSGCGLEPSFSRYESLPCKLV